jgi:hypothetical protein
MNNNQIEVTVKARITENKNGNLVITLIMDEYDAETLVIENGTLPRGIISKVVAQVNEVTTPILEA